MIRLTLAAALAAFLLAVPSAWAADPRIEQALAQERTYTQQATTGSTPTRTADAPAPAPDSDVPVALLATAIAAGLLLASGGVAFYRRHMRSPTPSLHA
jgi:hypothetical protein